ncbi:MAG: metallophosphoesterase [Phycisphaerales bacterium]|nr:metallophosphoesterase [Phycisphaerae bacterium]NNF42541.1 metallophosphoesterase [Phycisphaerales bacterium]NNM27502.1 metallophosphoesterase [Phycisphaerales bacterium]
MDVSPPDLRDADAVIELFDAAVTAQETCSGRSGSAVRLPARGRLLATGDLHDNPLHLEKIVRLARLDADDDHHVVLHEMIHGERLINGMDFSYRMLARVASLVVAAPHQTHPMLANHELSQLTGAGVSKGAGNSVQLVNEALDFAYGDRGVEVADALGRFITAMPLAVMTEGGVLCAHSLPAPAAMDRFDLDVLDRPLVEDDLHAPDGAAYLMTWGRHQTEEQIETLARRWNVSLFCLGHQHVETGIEARGRRVVILNSDHEHAMVLPLDLAELPAAAEAPLFAVPLASVS